MGKIKVNRKIVDIINGFDKPISMLEFNTSEHLHRFYIKGSKDAIDYCNRWYGDSEYDHLIEKFTTRHINQVRRKSSLAEFSTYIKVFFDVDDESTALIVVCENTDDVWVQDESQWLHDDRKFDQMRKKAGELRLEVAEYPIMATDYLTREYLCQWLANIANHIYSDEGMQVFMLIPWYWWTSIWTRGGYDLRKKLIDLFLQLYS